jgi:CBS domain-containing protein
MIPRPHSVFENDTIQKCLDIFRLMNLRALPVVNEDNGSLVGIITRQDLFAFMSV